MAPPEPRAEVTFLRSLPRLPRLLHFWRGRPERASSVALLVLGLLLAAAGCSSPPAPTPSPTPSGVSQAPPSPGGDFVIGSGRRILPHEYLPPVAPDFFEARRHLVAWLQHGRKEDLVAAQKLLDDGGKWSDWFPYLHLAWVKELQGDKAGRDKVLADRKVDKDVYAYAFGRGPDKALEMIQAQNFAFCQRILRVINQAAYDHMQGQGAPPARLEDLAAQFDGRIPGCPSGGEYVLTAKPGAYQIDCTYHGPENGFPQISAPDGLLSREVNDYIGRHHQYEQLLWKATRTPERDVPMFEALAKAADLKPGDRVADVGSGIAFFTYEMLKRVSPGGEAWSVDAKAGIIEYVDFVNARRPKAERVKTIASRDADTMLPADHFDAVIVAHLYRSLTSPRREQWEFDQLVKPFVLSIRKGLKVGGRFVIMDGHPEDTSSPLAISRDKVVQEVTSLGFRWLEGEGADGLVGDTPNEYVVVFEKVETASPR